jgi:hypothetical protein
MAQVKPKNRQYFDVHANTGFSIRTAMEHHQCFHIYIVKTRATRISDTVFFKHQYITNPQVTPKTLIIKAASDLTCELKGTISRNGKMAEALQKVRELFTKIAAAKSELAKAKEQQNNLQNHPNARQAVPLPRIAKRPPTPASQLPRVPIEIAEADFRVTLLPTQTGEGGTPQQETCSQPTTRPNYISQDKDDDKPNHRYHTRSRTTSIMEEAMLACINITKPKLEISAAKLATRKFSLIWLCKMANYVIGKHDELLEYRHLIANPKTRDTWTHSYGNKLGQLAQGMPGQVMGMDTIFFIPKDKVPQSRAKDVTYGLITCLIRLEKTNEPNQTRLVAGGDRVQYPFAADTPSTNLLTIKLLINSMISTPGARFFTIDIKNFYLCTPMMRYEYMQLKLSDMPDNVIAHYHLHDTATPNG